MIVGNMHLPIYAVVISIIHFSAFSISYQENCNEDERKLSEKFAKDTKSFNPKKKLSNEKVEAKSCDLLCATKKQDGIIKEISTLHEDLNQKRNELIIPPICFYASTLRSLNNKTIDVYNCKVKDEDKTPQFPLELLELENPVRPCLNKDYIELTARSFHEMADCFSFSEEEKKQIFALFNHESAFLLNAKSQGSREQQRQGKKEGARCYGQLTSINIKETNKQIYFRDAGYPFGYIYKKLVKKCPELKNKVITSKIAEAKRPRTLDELNQTNDNAPFTCGLTYDPYSCLLYSMYSIQINMDLFKNEYETTLKENTTTYQGTPLFEKDVLKTFFTDTAHNGGPGIIRAHLTFFMKKLKQNIEKCEEDREDSECKIPYSKYHSLLLEGKSLDISDLRTEFEKHGKNNGIKPQVIGFSAKIGKDMDFIHNASNNLIKKKLKLAAPKVNSDEINHFIATVKKKCPKSIHSTKL